jgi:hypothetical protein
VDDEPDYDYFYNVGSASLLDTSQVRAPEEGLKLIFGFGPWVWQQWACLQLETFTRFQQDHDQDFVNANFRKVASDLWTYWVENKRNAEFKVLYDGVEAWKPPKNGPGTQEKLMTHIMSPFRIMDDIAKNKGDKYTLVDDVSIFTYVSYLGSGWVTVIITLVIQFTVPILLLITAVESLSGPKRFSNGGFDTNWNDFCRDDGALSGRLMNIMVLLLYMIRVLPNLLYEFYSSSGEDDTGSSKMDEVRRQIFEQGDDTPWMQFGYKLDIYANSVYICMIMTLMLFILFLTDDIFNIILNALALEFVGSLDEELSKGDWFDAGGRFVTAAATELLIRATLRLEWIEDASKFQTEYGIDPAAWARAMYIANGKCNEDEYDEAMRAKEGLLHEKITRSMSKYMNVSLCDYRQGRKDSTNPNLMSKKGRYQHQAAKVARETKNKLAIWNFVEEVHQFGVIDQLAVMVRFMDTGMFMRYSSYYTWSRWGRVLYLCPTPKIDEWNKSRILACNRLPAPETVKSKGSHSTRTMQAMVSVGDGLVGQTTSVRKFFKSQVDLLRGGVRSDDFLNFDNEDFDATPMERFADLIVNKLLFKGVAKSVGTAIRRGDYYEIPFRLVDGLIDWFSYLYQLSFTFIIFFFMYLVLACY